MYVYSAFATKNFILFFNATISYNHRSMIDFLKKLIQADSSPDAGELDTARIIAEKFKNYDISSTVDTWDNNRANILARIKYAGKSPALLFVCHLDVVPPGQSPWKYPPFEAHQADGKIFGRGATDMKAGIATVVTAICQTIIDKSKLKGDIFFLATAGEETDSCGIKRFMKNDAVKLPLLQGIIVPEPTDFQIVTSHRGILWLKVTTTGKAAHGSAPQLGLNAITLMNQLLNGLTDYKIPYKPHPLLGNCTFSVNQIAGGKATNIIPDSCSIKLDVRTLPEQNHQNIIVDLEKIFKKLKSANPDFNAKAEIIRSVPALQTDPQSIFVRTFCKAVSIESTISVGFTTDGPFLTPLACPVLAFGPGKGEVCHKSNEYIETDDLKKAVNYYKKIISAFLT